MGVECMECSRKSEEELYWSCFQVKFCQILSGRFDQQLAIPKKFASSLKDKLAGTVTLKGPSCHTWDVGLVTNGDLLLFKHGWKAFVEDNFLKENDILIFKYSGDSRFDVLMFDQRSLCEKEAAYFSKNCKHAESGCSSKRRRGMPVYIEATSKSSDDVTECRARKIRTNAARTPTSNRMPIQAKSRGRRGTDKGKQISIGAFVQLKSRRREVTEEEKERAKQMAGAASSDNSFIVVMRASHVYKGFFMSIPFEWARIHLPRKNQNVVLRVKENSWQAKYDYKGYGGGLSGGWKNFVHDNFLEEWDVCLFDLVNEACNTYILDVSIFRVVEEVIPPSKVTKAAFVRVSTTPTEYVRNPADEDRDG